MVVDKMTWQSKRKFFVDDSKIDCKYWQNLSWENDVYNEKRVIGIKYQHP